MDAIAITAAIILIAIIIGSIILFIAATFIWALIATITNTYTDTPPLDDDH
jgi:hypothetical protein